MKYSVLHHDRGMLCKDKKSWTWDYEDPNVFKSASKPTLEKFWRSDAKINIVQADSPWPIAYYARGWVD